ncbi:hypothetical protein NUITMVA2_22120 [Aeromonas caviae]|uniref:Uncharacterized protein n=1 Tax=Klebsiella pneumoniae TaxID=573 RepID=A0A2L1KJZ1_KLEPN|nr:hypothetical protein [Klebsiella pneumoniae]BDC86855.1 hypothetical protein NUITMVA2_22120 [Aeromonas caviae]
MSNLRESSRQVRRGACAVGKLSVGGEFGASATTSPMLGGFYQSYTYALTPRTWHNVPTLQERNVAGVALLRIRADRKLGKP